MTLKRIIPNKANQKSAYLMNTLMESSKHKGIYNDRKQISDCIERGKV